MPYTATIQQIQRNNNADTIDISIRFDGTGASAGNSIVKTYSYSSATIPDKPTLKASIAAIGQAMAAFDVQAAFLNGKVGQDVSGI